MSTRGAILLAIGTLILGLLIGLASGGVAGFALGQSSRGAVARNLPFNTQPNNPRQPNIQPTLPPQGGQRFQNANGDVVTFVEPNSPAEKAGLQVNDVITAVDNTKIDANHSLADLIGAHKPGDKVALTVTRGNQTLTINVELGASPQSSTTAYLGIRFASGFPTGGNRPRFQGPGTNQPNG